MKRSIKHSVDPLVCHSDRLSAGEARINWAPVRQTPFLSQDIDDADAPYASKNILLGNDDHCPAVNLYYLSHGSHGDPSTPRYRNTRVTYLAVPLATALRLTAYIRSRYVVVATARANVKVISAQALPAAIAATPVACRSSEYQSGNDSLGDDIARALICQAPPRTHLLATSVAVHSPINTVSRILNMVASLFVLDNLIISTHIGCGLNAIVSSREVST
jgi:hypothetical protein